MAIILPYKGALPTIDPTAFVAPNVTITGNVTVGAQSSLWFGAVLRGDVMPIRIGERVSIQDNAVVHATLNWCDTEIGNDVTVGHAAILHGCVVSDRVLVGMGSIIMDFADIGSDTVVAAGSVVTVRSKIPSGVLAMGRPAKVIRELTHEEREMISDSARRYIEYSSHYRT